jgi:hypothetical protein
MVERKKRRYPRSSAEREAWNAHVDETIARMRGLAEKAWAELQAKKRAEEGKAAT